MTYQRGSVLRLLILLSTFIPRKKQEHTLAGQGGP